MDAFTNTESTIGCQTTLVRILGRKYMWYRYKSLI